MTTRRHSDLKKRLAEMKVTEPLRLSQPMQPQKQEPQFKVPLVSHSQKELPQIEITPVGQARFESALEESAQTELPQKEVYRAEVTQHEQPRIEKAIIEASKNERPQSEKTTVQQPQTEAPQVEENA